MRSTICRDRPCPCTTGSGSGSLCTGSCCPVSSVCSPRTTPGASYAVFDLFLHRIHHRLFGVPSYLPAGGELPAAPGGQGSWGRSRRLLRRGLMPGPALSSCGEPPDAFRSVGRRSDRRDSHRHSGNRAFGHARSGTMLAGGRAGVCVDGTAIQAFSFQLSPC